MKALATGAAPQLNNPAQVNAEVARFGRGGVENIETGSEDLDEGQLTVEVAFLHEKSTAAYIFNPHPYIKDPNDPPQIITGVVVSQTTRGFVVKLSAAPATDLSTMHWGVAVVDELYVNGPEPDTPNYVLDGNLVHLDGDQEIAGKKSFEVAVGNIWDRGGQFYNIMAFGGKGDGVTDNLEAFNNVMAAIIAAGGYGSICFPEGVFLFSDNAVATARINIIGSSRYGTELKFSSGSLILGDADHLPSPLSFNGRIAHLTISRDSSFPPPAGSIGIKALYYQYIVIDDVFIVTHDIGLKTGNGTSTLSSGLKITNSVIFNIGSSDLWLEDAIQTTLINVDFGKGGVLNDPTNAFIVFSGVTDTFDAIACKFFGSPATAFSWENYTSTNGIFQLSHIHVEGPELLCRSDAGTARINHLQITNSRLTADTKLWDFNAATELTSLDISHNPQISFVEDTTITKLYRARFCSNVCAGGLIFAGGGDGELSLLDNTFQTAVVLSGAWTVLHSLFNKMRGPTSTYTLTATGNVVSKFNTDKNGVVIPLLYPKPLGSRSRPRARGLISTPLRRTLLVIANPNRGKWS
jgi:hypothetical protein